MTSIFPTRSFFSHAASSAALRELRATPEPGPDDVHDPDQPVRDNSGGPDDRNDPDGYGRGSGDSYSGPDGSYDTLPF